MIPQLLVNDVSVGYGAGAAAVRALSGVTLSFHPGQLTLVMGPSGSGKTTLLSVLGCLLTPDAGDVSVMGSAAKGLSQDAAGHLRNRYIGYVFQAFRLFRSLTALENVLIALELGGVGGTEAAKKALNALERTGIAHRAQMRPAQLSGGEKQRVAIARALVNDPAILLADEPTASLDQAAGDQIADLLHQLAAERNRIVVVVTHDNRWLERSDRVVTMSDGKVINDSGAQ